MTGGSFGAGILFAAFAALAAIPWSMIAAPVLGHGWALAGWCLLLAVLHGPVIAPDARRAWVALALALVLAVVAAALSPTPAVAMAAAAGVLAIVRSGVLYRGPFARSLLLEAVLLTIGLLVARWLAAPGVLGLALGVWSFFLAQSLFFLVGAGERRRTAEPATDPFEQARRQALELMEEAG